jgi:glycosyltransferase involved in cell wall biosynthesis
MNIALLSFWFTDYTIQLANSLSASGLEVHLILSDNQLSEYTEIGKRVKTYIYNQPRLFDPIKNIFLVYKIFKQISSFEPDIIHLQGAHFWFSFILPLLHLKKYKLIVTFHDVKPHIGENYLRVRFAQYCERKYSDKTIVHGKKLKEIMIKKYNFPDEKELKENGNLILFFGRVNEYKGLEYLIKAEPIITKEVPDVKIVIAGTGEDFKKYEKMMTNRDNFIVHNRYIPYKEGAELLQRCSLVVLPYIDASQSGVILTAYGFKKPVVVTDVGSIPEIVDDGVTGFIVPPKNPKTLAEAIVKLLKDEKLRKQMGENAYKKLKTDLSWDKIAEKTIEVYRKAIKDKSCK